jgi:hypothetical protein
MNLVLSKRLALGHPTGAGSWISEMGNERHTGSDLEHTLKESMLDLSQVSRAGMSLLLLSPLSGYVTFAAKPFQHRHGMYRP